MLFKITEKKIAQWESAGKTDKLLKALDHKDPQVKGWAASALGRLGDVRAIEPILRLRANPAFFQAANHALEPLTIALLRISERVASRFMGEGEQKFIQAVPHLLAAVGPNVVPWMLDFIRSPVSTVRIIVISVLGMLNVKDQVTVIVRALNDGNALVRRQAIQVLRHFGPAISEQVFFDFIKKEKLLFAPEAAKDVMTLGYTPKNREDSIRYAIALHEFDRACQIHESVMTVMVGYFEKPENITEDFKSYLAALGDQSAPVLIEGTRSTTWKARDLALTCLIKGKSVKAIGTFFEFFNHHDKSIANGIRENLKHFGKATFDYLEQALLEDGEASMPKEAITWTQEIGWKPKNKQIKIALAIHQEDWMTAAAQGATAIAPLSLCLARSVDSPGVEHKTIIQALGSIRDNKVIPVLEPYLTHRDAYVREAVIQALETIGTKQVIPLLEKALAEKAHHLRRKIAQVLDKLGASQWTTAVQGEYQDYYRLGTKGIQGVVARLMEDLTAPTIEMRRQAGTIIAQLGQDHPALLAEQWAEIHRLTTTGHQDVHTDHDYDRSSDCTHDDSHMDEGVGLAFPEHPPTGAGKTDF